MNAHVAADFTAGWALKGHGAAHYFYRRGDLLFSLCGRATASAAMLRLPQDRPRCRGCLRCQQSSAADASSAAVVPARP